MRVLLDENLPHDLASELVGHDVVTVQGLGWGGMKNGELLQRATDTIDAFLTMDRNIEHQQKIGVLSFGIVLIRAQVQSDARPSTARERPLGSAPARRGRHDSTYRCLTRFAAVGALPS